MLTILSLVLAAEAGSPLLDYERARTDLESRRIELGAELKKHPQQARQRARSTLLSYFENSAFPAWKGTTWNFYGTTTRPGEGTIACGYYVTTVMEQAGFHLQRVLLAQQASRTWSRPWPAEPASSGFAQPEMPRPSRRSTNASVMGSS